MREDSFSKTQHLLLDKASYLDLPYVHLSTALHHHLFRVLRVKVDDILYLCHQGSAFYLSCQAIETSRIRVNVLKKLRLKDGSFRFHLLQVLPKQDKFSEILRANVELGVHHIIPLTSQFCAVSSNIVSQRQSRWEKILFSAALQSKRSLLPQLKPLLRFHDLPNFSSPAIKLLFWENAPIKASVFDYFTSLDIHHDQPLDVYFLIGSEGGFHEDEVKFAQSLGFQVLSLGASVLRVEHASVVALAQIKGFLHYLLNKS